MEGRPLKLGWIEGIRSNRTTGNGAVLIRGESFASEVVKP